MSEEPIPARSAPVAARAPGKCILFGEHAVVHGEPELLFAMDLYTQVMIRPGRELRLNGDAETARGHSYLQAALDRFGRDALEFQVVSRVPRAAGLGSSAAFCAGVAAGLGALHGGLSRAKLAEESFLIERTAQSLGSPGDTTASVAGGYVAVNGGSGAPLWELGDGTRRWVVRRVPDPGWTWIVAYSGIPRNTAETVKAVGRRLAAPDGPKLLERFREVAASGITAVTHEDRAATARELGRNQELLREVGVSHPRLEALLEAAAPASEGGKLTGAGAGGSVVLLPRPGRELEASRLIARAGGVPFVVRPAPRGAELVEPPPPL